MNFSAQFGNYDIHSGVTNNYLYCCQKTLEFETQCILMQGCQSGHMFHASTVAVMRTNRYERNLEKVEFAVAVVAIF